MGKHSKAGVGRIWFWIIVIAVAAYFGLKFLASNHT